MTTKSVIGQFLLQRQKNLKKSVNRSIQRREKKRTYFPFQCQRKYFLFIYLFIHSFCKNINVFVFVFVFVLVNEKPPFTKKNHRNIINKSNDIMLDPHLPEIDKNDLQLEVSRKQTLNLSTHLVIFELLAYWLQIEDNIPQG